MQASPDYKVGSYTPKAFQENFGLTFTGPGFYLTSTDTVLILPNPPDSDPTVEDIWSVAQPEGTLYDVYVYNVPYNQTIFAAIGAGPVRVNNRIKVGEPGRDGRPIRPVVAAYVVRNVLPPGQLPDWETEFGGATAIQDAIGEAVNEAMNRKGVGPVENVGVIIRFKGLKPDGQA